MSQNGSENITQNAFTGQITSDSTIEGESIPQGAAEIESAAQDLLQEIMRSFAFLEKPSTNVSPVKPSVTLSPLDFTEDVCKTIFSEVIDEEILHISNQELFNDQLARETSDILLDQLTSILIGGLCQSEAAADLTLRRIAKTLCEEISVEMCEKIATDCIAEDLQCRDVCQEIFDDVLEIPEFLSDYFARDATSSQLFVDFLDESLHDMCWEISEFSLSRDFYCREISTQIMSEVFTEQITLAVQTSFSSDLSCLRAFRLLLEESTREIFPEIAQSSAEEFLFSREVLENMLQEFVGSLIVDCVVDSVDDRLSVFRSAEVLLNEIASDLAFEIAVDFSVRRSLLLDNLQPTDLPPSTPTEISTDENPNPQISTQKPEPEPQLEIQLSVEHQSPNKSAKMVQNGSPSLYTSFVKRIVGEDTDDFINRDAFRKAVEQLKSLWNDAPLTSEEKIKFGDQYCCEATSFNFLIVTDEIDRLLTMRTHSLEINAIISRREELILQLWTIVQFYDQRRMLDTEKYILLRGVLDDLDATTKQVQTAIQTWADRFSMRTPYLWRSISYPSKMQTDTDFFHYSELKQIITSGLLDTAITAGNPEPPLPFPLSGGPAEFAEFLLTLDKRSGVDGYGRPNFSLLSSDLGHSFYAGNGGVNSPREVHLSPNVGYSSPFVIPSMLGQQTFSPQSPGYRPWGLL